MTDYAQSLNLAGMAHRIGELVDELGANVVVSTGGRIGNRLMRVTDEGAHAWTLRQACEAEGVSLPDGQACYAAWHGTFTAWARHSADLRKDELSPIGPDVEDVLVKLRENDEAIRQAPAGYVVDPISRNLVPAEAIRQVELRDDAGGLVDASGFSLFLADRYSTVKDTGRRLVPDWHDQAVVEGILGGLLAACYAYTGIWLILDPSRPLELLIAVACVIAGVGAGAEYASWGQK